MWSAREWDYSTRVLDDVRLALRGLARSPLTAGVLLVSLALGTGVNAVLYTVMDALLFRAPAGVADASGLLRVFTSQFNGGSYGPTSHPDFASLQTAAPAFASLAAYDDSSTAAVTLDNSMQRVRVVAVSPEFFPTLGMQPQAGVFPGTHADSGQSVVISDGLWTLFGRPADVVGKAITVGEEAYVVGAIAPPRFNGLQLGRACDLWLPLRTPAGASRGDRRLSVIGRLAAGRGLAEAAAQAGDLSRRLAEAHPETNKGTRSDEAEPRRMQVFAYSRLEAAARGQVQLISTVVLGSTGLLLLSACVNAGSLLLSRSAARRRELAVKLALGANRTRLVRQVLIDSTVIAVGGAALGLLAAHWSAGALPAFFAPEEAAMLDTTLQPGVIAAAFALSCAAACFFAIGPSRHALQAVDVLALRGDAGLISDRSGGAMRAVVVVGQVALSTVLLIVSGLMARALNVALEGDMGPGRNVAVALARMPGALEGDVARGIRFHAAASEAARKLPAARAVGWVSTLPVGRNTNQVFTLETGRAGVSERIDVEVNAATAGYFQALRVPLIEGRLFNADDGALSKPVIVVNDLLARRYFGPSAAGNRLRDASGTEFEVIGVVGSGRYRTLQEAPEPTVYFPLSQVHQAYMHLVVRTAESPDAVLAELPRLLTGIDEGVAIRLTTSFEDHLAQALTLDRILTTVVAACGIAALVLATMGVYGVVADAVRRRTPEIGLRVALGASAWRILRLVLSEGLPLTALGAAAGIAAALLLVRTLRLFVHAIPPIDLTALAIVPAALLLVVLGAGALPTRRALRVSPTIALKADG
jgi:putative ABC transport system permease protein